MGRIGLINSGGESKGASDLAEAVRTAVINKRAGGMGLISGRKAFQRPTAEGVELLNAIQDVYLDESHHARLSATEPSRDLRVADRGAPSPDDVHRMITTRGSVADTCRTRPIAPSGRRSSIDRVIIRFAGDSGDGMQLTGDRFTSASALFGNDLATLPEFPAEIRAPAGTLAGVSAFQVHISDHDITTPGDAPERAGGHEPGGAAGRAAPARAAGGTLIVNADTFDERNLTKAGYRRQPARPTAASTATRSTRCR